MPRRAWTALIHFMSLHGTNAYRHNDNTLPVLVQRAVKTARTHGFAFSCRPEQRRLLQLLAAGAPHRIAETGTGCGVGPAWLASGASPGTRLISIERDRERARITADVFKDCSNAQVRTAEAKPRAMARRTPRFCSPQAAQ